MIAIILFSISGLTTGGVFAVRSNQVGITYMHRAGVIIEGEGIRVYIDPSAIDDKYERKPADVIFVTHSHIFHYDYTSIRKIRQDSTKFVFPASESGLVSFFNATPASIGENSSCGDIKFEVFPSYNNYASNHPKSKNWTGYLITIDGLTIFHPGDSDLVEEFAGLEDRIDIALLPIFGEGKLMSLQDAIEFCKLYRPKYMIPIHINDFDVDTIPASYQDEIPDTKIIPLNYGESHWF